MQTLSAQVIPGRGPRGGKKYFTLDEARRTLPLVRRIARDLQATQQERIRLHETMKANGGRLLAEQEAQFERLTDRMEELLAELMPLGVELKDASTGLLDFPALHEGREVLLCWKGDEETITHWHEAYGGFTARKPVELLNMQVAIST